MRTVFCWTVALLGLPVSAATAGVEYLASPSDAGLSEAVIVDGVALAHTAQVFPLDAVGKAVAPAEQLKQAVLNLQTALAQVGSGLERAVKINVYATSDAVVADTRQRLAQVLPESSRPAVTYVVTRLPHPEATLALDAVAIADSSDAQPATVRRERVPGWKGMEGTAHVSVLPAGRVVYISGQAERGEDLADSTRKTMESLHTTLEHLGLNKSHAVEVKAFLTPMSDVDSVRRTIASLYDDGLAPPLSCVEWSSSLPIEIEMVAHLPGGDADAQGPAVVKYVTPPGMTASPVFSRVAVVERGRLVFTSGLYPSKTEDFEAQITSLFDRLRNVLKWAGTDLRHLAKGTYYVSDDKISRGFSQIRQQVYDPQRPPAASKATVTSIGQPESTITLDMIAVAPQ